MGAVLVEGNLGDEGEVQTSNEEAFEADILLAEVLEALEVQLEVQAEKKLRISILPHFEFSM